MKNLLLLAVLACVSLQMQAQDYEEREIAKELYFENAVFRLTNAQQQALDTLWQHVQGAASYQIRIQGTADERGSARLNEQLPRQRSQAVRDYLLQKGAAADRIEILQGLILPVGIVKNNRRTDISVRYTKVTDTQTTADKNTPQAPSSFASFAAFTAYNAAQATQQHKIQNEKNARVRGRKGAILHIPKMAFVNAAGVAQTGDILIELREAHSYGDMILQNLSTESGSSLLETGGMVHIAAFNSKGESLQLAKGKEIIISMPSASAQLEGMQTFVGTEDPHEGVDWMPSNVAVVNAEQAKADLSPFLGGKGYIDINDLRLRNAFINEDSRKAFESKLPKFVPAPPAFTKVAPARPKLPVLDEPMLGDYYQKYEKQGQTFKQYSVRARKEYKADFQAFDRKRQAQNRQFQAYSRDSLRHAAAIAQHEQKIADYKAYQTELRYRLHLIHQHNTSFSSSDYEAKISSAAQLVAQLNTQALYNTRREYLLRQLEELSKKNEAFAPLLTAAKNSPAALISESNAQEIAKTSESTTAIAQEIQQQRQQAEALLKSERDAKEVFNGSASYNIARLLRKTVWTDSDYNSAREWIKIACDGYKKVLQNQQQRHSKNLDKLAPLCHQITQNQSTLVNLNEQMTQLMAELGLLSPRDIAAQYENAMSVNGLGWINCDRFTEPASSRTDLQILSQLQHSKDTKFYALFEDMNAVMLSTNDNGVFKFKSLPVGRSVKIVGLCISTDKAEMFVERISISKNMILNAKFEPKTLKELFAALQNV